MGHEQRLEALDLYSPERLIKRGNVKRRRGGQGPDSVTRSTIRLNEITRGSGRKIVIVRVNT